MNVIVEVVAVAELRTLQPVKVEHVVEHEAVVPCTHWVEQADAVLIVQLLVEVGVLVAVRDCDGSSSGGSSVPPPSIS